MIGHKRRIRALQAIVAGLTPLAATSTSSLVNAEFDEVYKSRRLRHKDRRRLLQVLHSTRALDSALSAFVSFHGCTTKTGKPPTGLGGYLTALKEHSVTGLTNITETERSHFQKQIAKPRNRYMHQAGAFPVSETDLDVLLSEMHACLVRVARLSRR